MRILISGASGFVGSAVFAHLEQKGHSVFKLSHASWDLPAEEFDAVIHLAGEPIASRWTPEKKERILTSRVQNTQRLSQALARLPPKFFLSASAIGYYGDRGDELLTEDSPPGHNFLSDVCIQWEQASSALEKRGVRTVHARFGAVLGKGGMLQQLLLPYKLCLGGPLGTGHQWLSWIALSDLVQAIDFCLHHTTLSGPVNFVSPHPVHQREFARTLASLLHRPALFPQPAFLLRLLFGQMADEVLLSSARVHPNKLLAAHFSFHSSDLKETLQKVLR